MNLGARRWWHTFFFVTQFSLRGVLLRKASWFGVLSFAACLLILFPFAFGTELLAQGEVRHGAFWAIQEFVVALVVGRVFQAEQENGALEALLASRAPRSALLFAKTAFTAVQLLSLQIPLVLLWAVFYNVPTEGLMQNVRFLLPVCLLFNFGTSALGALLSCVVARSQAREILLPILFFPLQMAPLLAAVTLMLRNDPAYEYVGGFADGSWWTVLAAYPVVFLAVGFLLDDVLLQE
ncbi:MAG: heme exporter protein CcmB [Silvanigrellales bacterium]|jgi:heme exporter protein B|nr:heme exporter protein CcmB [Silvanigrellales bacterium]